MKLSAIITFKSDEKPIKFRLLPHGDNKPWRFLADNCAVELVPVCDSEAQLINEPPARCDSLEIWPVQWGYPDLLVSKHPDEVEQMRQDHLAGKHDLIDGKLTWEHWLKHDGKAELWHSFRTPEMEEHWLNWRNGPGSTLSTFAGLAGHIKREVLKLIKFHADFYIGDTCRTIYLSDCCCSPLTQAEIRNSPEHLAEQKKLADKQAEIEAVTARKVNNERKLVADKLKLESVKADNHRKEEQAMRLRAGKPVTKTEVLAALKVKTDRAARMIFKRHGFDGWPQTQGELDRLAAKHWRHKKTLGEALRKRNKDRNAKRRGFDSDADRKKS